MKLVYNAIQTPDGTVLESRHRHDFKEHTDTITGNTYMIDGGLDYIRTSMYPDQVNLAVYLEDGHDKVRSSITWGTYGKNGDQPMSFVKLCDMDTDHIKACIKGQPLHPQIKTAFKNELLYRKE